MLRLLVIMLTICEVITIVASVRLLGLFPTLLLAIIAFAVGLYLLRREGLATAEKFIVRLQHGQAPMAEAWEGICLVVAALLLMLPGLFSDAIALALLLPVVRRGIWTLSAKRGTHQNSYLFRDTPAASPPRNDNTPGSVPGSVIDANWRELP